MKLKRSTLLRAAVALAATGLFTGCGGDSIDSDVNIQVTPAKGIIINGVVTIYDTSGRRLGRADTGTDGVAQLSIPRELLLTGANYSPVIVEVRASSSTQIWDESGDFGRGRFITSDEIPSDFSLMAVSPQARERLGVTALTTMSAATAGIKNPSQPPSGLDAEGIVSAIARVNALMGLPPTFDITLPPTPASPSQPEPDEEYGALVRAITMQSGRSGALQQVLDFGRAGDALHNNELPVSSLELGQLVNQAAQDLGLPDTPTDLPTNLTELSARVSQIIDALRKELTGAGDATGVTGVTGITGLTN